MNRNVLAAATAAAVAIFLTTNIAAAAPACEPDKLAQKYPSLAGATIKVGIDPNTPPYAMRNPANMDEVAGFDVDLAKAVFDCQGIKYEFVLGAWTGILPAVVNDQIDVMWDNLYYTPDRAKQVDYVVYMQAGTGALTQAGNPKGINAMDQMCGATVAVGLGTVEEPMVKEEDAKCLAAGKDGIQMMPFPDMPAAVRLIENNRADIVLYDLALIDKLVADRPDVLARAFMRLSGFGLGTAVKKGKGELNQAIFDGLSIMQAQGKQADIFRKYTIDPALQLPAEIKVN